MRRGVGNWLAKVLLGLLIIAFCGLGHRRLRAQGRQVAPAKIGDTEITADQYRRAYQEEMNAISRRLGRRLTPEQAKLFGVEQSALARLVNAAAIDQHARELKLSLSDAAIAEIIKQEPAFRGADGKFSPVAFQGFLRQNGTQRGPLPVRPPPRRGPRPDHRIPAVRRGAPAVRDRAAAPVSRRDARHRLPRARLRQADQARPPRGAQAARVLRAEQAPVRDARAAQGQRAAADPRRRQGARQRHRRGGQGGLREEQGQDRHSREAAHPAAGVPRQGRRRQGLRRAGQGQELQRGRDQARLQGGRHRSRPPRPQRDDRSQDRRGGLRAEEGRAVEAGRGPVRPRAGARQRDRARQAAHLRRGEGRDPRQASPRSAPARSSRPCTTRSRTSAPPASRSRRSPST